VVLNFLFTFHSSIVKENNESDAPELVDTPSHEAPLTLVELHECAVEGTLQRHVEEGSPALRKLTLEAQTLPAAR
jgi:hypothetical protein